MLSHMAGIQSREVMLSHGRVHFLERQAKSSSQDVEVVVLVHGNTSSSTFWEETIVALPEKYTAIAPDMRGYGESECLAVDATRGMRDFSDDLHRLVDRLGLTRFHLIGHSLGGCVVMQYVIDHADRVKSLALVATGSPFGFGGTKDEHGTPCWPDHAGSGGGLVNPELHRRIEQNDRSNDTDFSPRRILRNHLVNQPCTLEREDALLEGLLSTATGEGNYSRDMIVSLNWPFLAPGTRGVNNAISPKYTNLSSLADIDPKPPIFWVRGSHDRVVSDQSFSDMGTLGEMGLIPGWPGRAVFPSQPMILQIRTLLKRYQAHGGIYYEETISGAGHMPHLERPHLFSPMLHTFLRQHTL